MSFWTYKPPRDLLCSAVHWLWLSFFVLFFIYRLMCIWMNDVTIFVGVGANLWIAAKFFIICTCSNIQISICVQFRARKISPAIIYNVWYTPNMPGSGYHLCFKNPVICVFLDRANLALFLVHCSQFTSAFFSFFLLFVVFKVTHILRQLDRFVNFRSHLPL